MRSAQRSSTMAASVAGAVRVGVEWGRKNGHADRPRPRRHTGRATSSRTRARSPSPRRCALGAIRPMPLDDQQTALERGAGTTVGHEGLLGVKRFLDSSTPHRGAFTYLRHQIVSSHDLDQRAWTSQLDGVLDAAALGVGALLVAGVLHAAALGVGTLPGPGFWTPPPSESGRAPGPGFCTPPPSESGRSSSAIGSVGEVVIGVPLVVVAAATVWSRLRTHCGDPTTPFDDEYAGEWCIGSSQMS